MEKLKHKSLGFYTRVLCFLCLITQAEAEQSISREKTSLPRCSYVYMVLALRPENFRVSSVFSKSGSLGTIFSWASSHAPAAWVQPIYNLLPAGEERWEQHLDLRAQLRQLGWATQLSRKRSSHAHRFS